MWKTEINPFLIEISSMFYAFCLCASTKLVFSFPEHQWEGTAFVSLHLAYIAWHIDLYFLKIMLLKMSDFIILIAKCYYIVYNIFFFIHAFNNGNLYPFPIVAIPNGGMISTELLIPFIMILLPLELYPIVKFLHQMVAWRISPMSSRTTDCSNRHSHQQCVNSLLYFLAKTWHFLWFDIMVLIVFPDDYWIEQFFSYLATFMPFLK